MKLVIEIPDNEYHQICELRLHNRTFYDDAIRNGTPLPKGHWVDTDEWRETVDGFEQWGYFRKCSKCGYVFKFLEIDNYCPSCGSKNEKVVEGEKNG